MYPSLEGLSISIAMPIYNESDGIAETLTSIDEAFRESGATVTMCIQNDVSTDNTLQVLAKLGTSLQLNVEVETNQRNSGHGPTTFTAYQRALNSGSSIIMQLDSDGQFDATELPVLCSAIAEGKEVVIGIRSNRVDPWFRKFLTYFLRNFLRARYVGRFPDPNSPIRAYSTSVLGPMLDELPNEPLIPNIYLSILAVRKKLEVSYIHVSHRERRGGQTTGTMWQSSNQWQKINRLLKFCRKSFRQLLSF
jgi:undecaprenyl-phosphate 4-deoxy-4-formamido-L-arabinose transferase